MLNGTSYSAHEINGGAAKMKVVGVGGGGGNAVNRMIEDGLSGVEFLQMNTDRQVLMLGKAPTKVQLGEQRTRGLGAGARPDTGAESALESRDDIAVALQGADLVFITCGMGGGTGTGAAPIVAEIARSQGALTIGIVTKPFHFEGRKRMQAALKGIDEMRKHVDTMIVVPNERLLAVVGQGIPFHEALKKADEVLRQATEGIAGLINESGLVNVDYADVRTIMQNGGSALMGRGIAEGENRAKEAALAAISSPLLDNMSIGGATGVLVNIVGGENLSLGEVHTINAIIHESVGDDAEIIFGAVQNNAFQDHVQVTVIATGFDASRAAAASFGNSSAAASPIGNSGGYSGYGGGFSASPAPAGYGAGFSSQAPAGHPGMPSNLRTTLPSQPREVATFAPPAMMTPTLAATPMAPSAPMGMPMARQPEVPLAAANLDLGDLEIPVFARSTF